MKSKSQRFLEELDYYSSQLNKVGAVLVNLAQAKKNNRRRLAEAGKAYQRLTRMLVDTYNSLKLEVCP